MAISDPSLGTIWGAGQPFHDHLLTNFFRDTVVDTKNNSSVLLSLIPSTTERISGRHVVFPAKTGRNTSAFNFVGDGGVLPDPGAASAVTYNFRAPDFFARVAIDGKILRHSNSDATRFVDALMDVMEQLEDDQQVEHNRVMYNDGSGRLAQITTGAASTTQTLTLNPGIESSATCTTDPTAFISVGDRLSFVAIDHTAIVTSTVTAIPSATTITISPSVTTVTGDWVVRSSTLGAAWTDTAFRREPKGLEAILSDGEPLDGTGISGSQQSGTDNFTAASGTGFQGVALTGNTWNQGIVNANAGVLRDPTEELFQAVFEGALEQNNAKIDMVLSKPGVRLAYGYTLLGDKRYNNTTTLTGGWESLMVSGRPWVVDRMAYDNRAYCLSLADGGFTQYVVEEYQPLDYYGPHWYRLPDRDLYHCAYVASWTIGVDVRDRCGVNVTDLNTAVTGATFTY